MERGMKMFAERERKDKEMTKRERCGVRAWEKATRAARTGTRRLTECGTLY